MVNGARSWEDYSTIYSLSDAKVMRVGPKGGGFNLHDEQ